MPSLVAPAVGDDRLAAVYQLKIHLLGISPHICRRVLVRGDTSLAELHHVFQIAMGWENWHLHRFKLWGKEYGIPYAGGIYFADDARRVHLGDFPWQVNDKWLLQKSILVIAFSGRCCQVVGVITGGR